MKKSIGVFFLGFAVSLLAVLIIVIVLVFTNPRFNQAFSSYVTGYDAGFEYAEFNKYNSSAEKNGLGGTAIYIIVDNISDNLFNEAAPAMSAFVGEGNGGTWLVATGALENPESVSNAIKSAKNIVVYGLYFGYSEAKKAPSIAATQLLIDNKIYTISSNVLG